MTERQMAKHTLLISFEDEYGPNVQLKCHGDKDSACWWPLGDDDMPKQADYCSLVEWQDSLNYIQGQIEIPVEVFSWDEDGPVMKLKPDDFVECKTCTADLQNIAGVQADDLIVWHKEGE
jgi:hypothetical protein